MTNELRNVNFEFEVEFSPRTRDPETFAEKPVLVSVAEKVAEFVRAELGELETGEYAVRAVVYKRWDDARYKS